MIQHDMNMTSLHGHDKKVPFRAYIASQSPYLKDIEKHTAQSHADDAVERLPLINGLLAMWQGLYTEPFRGFTNDGTVIPDLYTVDDGGIDIENITKAADNILGALTPAQRNLVMFPSDAKERRMWQNTHIYFSWFRNIGIRLDETTVELQSLILRLLELAMSPEGYRKAVIATETNEFLGSLYNGHGVLNKHSYNFALFGTPSASRPWGWTFFGHHLCLNFTIIGEHIDITPTFMGAEPNLIDEGQLAGTELYTKEERLGLQLMLSFSSELKRTARIRDSIYPPPGHKGPFGHAVSGAFQDNRVVPYEGAQVSSMTEVNKQLLLQIIEEFIIYLPEPARKRKLQQVQQYLNETHFAWIGETGDGDPFYYRIHSPVIFCEFEHCASIFLGNTEPKRFHIHTHVRHPNGGDYGHAILAQQVFVALEDLGPENGFPTPWPADRASI